MAPSNFAALAFFAGSVIAHLARRIVGMVVSVTVGTGDWVIADGEALLPVLLVDVRFLALLAGDVVVSLCQGHSHPKLSVAQGAGSKSSADKIQPTACRPMATGNTPVWFPGH